MYIEEVVLEGFKSYATRTVISNWDPQFNAITGLNGSGKSNILDAICFVLGIDNLRQVRATTLQDLVYKRGQSGITKASVSIVFNNSDPSQSPVGFTDQPQITVTRQIVVGGKNKYLINGHNTPQKVVETLFQSVQLNVNNPHFLIMQGQITKVLNMKPPEILAMVEETAGTRMFEDRRCKAESVMEKKEKKVEEIQGLLEDIIEPKLSTLRVERNDFVEFKRTEADMEQVERFVIASDHFINMQNLEKISTELLQKSEIMTEMQQESHANVMELQELNVKLEMLAKKRQKEAQNSTALRQLEAQSKEATMTALRIETDLNLQRKRFEEEQAKAVQLKKSIKAQKKMITEQGEQTIINKKQYDSTKDAYDKLYNKTMQDEELLQSLTTGVSATGSDTGYTKLLNDLKQQKSASTSTIQRAHIQLSELASELNSLEPKATEAKRELGKKMEAISGLKTEITALETKLTNSIYDPNTEVELTREKRQLDTKMRKLEEMVDELKAQVSQCDINFNINGVKGVVANLIDIPAEHSKYINALEVTAGGKLYNIVVEDEKVANTLLESGRLTRRVTIIPLNKIVSHSIHSEKLRLAHQLGSTESVHTALSLIGYQGDIEAAMQFVFGGTLICDASSITFDKRIQTRTVTIDGDVYEPSGILTGGSTARNFNLLSKLASYKSTKSELDQLKKRLQEVNKQLDALFDQRASIHADEQRLELKRQDLQAHQRQFELNPMGKILTRIDTIRNEVIRLEELIKEQSTLKVQLEKQIAEIDKDMVDFSENREGKLKTLQTTVNSNKSLLEKELVKLQKVQQTMQTTETALETQNAVLMKLEQEMSTCQSEAEGILVEIEKLDRQLSDTASKAKDLSERFDTEMRFIKQYDQELVICEERNIQLQNELEHYQMQEKKLSEEMTKYQGEMDRCKEDLNGALKKHAWLHDVISQLGQPDGSFHFTQHSVTEARRRFKQLQDQYRKLKSSININVMEMIDRVEAKETSLKQMLNTVKRDKQKIQETVTKLDSYKTETLMKTWTKVNEDFGNIFAELLPGSFCKLDVPEGQTITDGLEIKVSLGSVWKQSLAELSGGQRSVVALSLILALLQYKPAPMYILDEVDAALDLSHTQNIGNLLRTRFHGSQFIIVSLKEGMFNNANVLFRTRFKDGVSSVERFEHGTETSKEEGKVSKKKVKPVISTKSITA